MKKISRNLVVFSRHPSHSVLRRKPIPVPVRTCIRFGSVTEGNAPYVIQINSVESIRTSSSKSLMKNAFLRDGVKTPLWYKKEGASYRDMVNNTLVELPELPYPVVVKSFFGSRGLGNTLIKTSEELSSFSVKHNMDNYIVEKFYSYSREYRFHMTKDGCFYACRKMLKHTASEDKRWFRNDSNCVWIKEENIQFDKPSNWDTSIIPECIKALNSVGLDVGALDVRVQSKLDSKGRQRENPDFVILETNSAPSFGEITEEKYREIIPVIIKSKMK